MLNVKSISALLLVALAWVANAQLLEPGGDLVGSEQGVTFSFEHDVTIFGQVYQTVSKHFVYRKTGRVAIGTDGFDPDFEANKIRLFHFLQPSEVFSVRSIASSLRQGRLNSDQLVLLGNTVLYNFWNVETFKPLGGHIFTWDNQRNEDVPGEANVFQAVIVYNESSTYILNNYVKMDFKNAGNLMAGFSRRNSFESAFLPFTGNTAGQLANVSGVGNRTLGRFIYRIDSWPPRRGGCLTEDPASPADRTLSSTVTRDSVLGGSLAIVSGRCPEYGVNGTCAIRMGGRVVGQSSTVSCSECRNVFLACPVAPSYREGRATLSLKLSNTDREYSTEISFGNPDQIRRQIDLGSVENWMTLSSTTRQITYNPAGMRGNLTLHVIGYSESRLINGISAINTPVKILLKTPAKSDGQMDLSSLSCPADVSECDTHHVGYLEIVDNGSPRSLRSGIIPLGWFVNKYFLDMQRNNWYRDRCKSLSDNGAQIEKVRNQLKKLVCPSTIAQAKADTSRYLRLSYCPELPGGCASATPKQQCFVSRPETNTDTFGVPASVCCYSNTSGNMLYQEQLNTGNNNQAWTQHASRTIRSHPDGQPHAETLLPGQVSFMSHWYWDTLTFLYCCRWSNHGECPFYYMHERPTPKLSSYTVGRGSSNVGDPHMSSFSGQSFLFNGYGEYWLLQSDSFQVQGRYLTVGAINNATFLVALSVKVGNGPAFQATILPPTANPRFLIQRRMDNNVTDIQLSADYLFTEGGVTIKINNEDNIVIQLTSNTQSIGIDLYAVSAAGEVNFINTFISLSATMKGQTRGLLGRWTDDQANEFVTVDNNVVPFRQNASDFHEAFCVKNQLKSVTESLFNYDGNRIDDFEQINRIRKNAYRPIFSDEGLSHGQSSECQGDKNCLFDIRVTQNVDIARLTASHGKEFEVMQRATLNASVPYCDIPSLRGIQIPPEAILGEGASLTIACAASLRSSKAGETVQCRRQSDGTTLKWEPDPATNGFQCLIDDSDLTTASGTNVGLIVGISVPVAVLVVLLVAVAVVIARRRSDSAGGTQVEGGGRPKQQSQQQQRPPQKQLQTNSDSERGGRNNHAQGNRRGDATRHSNSVQTQMKPRDHSDFLEESEYVELQIGM